MLVHLFEAQRKTWIHYDFHKNNKNNEIQYIEKIRKKFNTDTLSDKKNIQYLSSSYTAYLPSKGFFEIVDPS